MFTLNYSLLCTAITGASLTAYSSTGDQMYLRFAGDPLGANSVTYIFTLHVHGAENAM